ncbi:MAG: low affinity iron permease family protein [Devosia sp.]
MQANLFERFAHTVSHLSGKPVTFGLACLLILGWAVTGPIFGFSETWQLVINTGTTIITFLMVFILQNSQNRDGQAIQAKLDELILVSAKAENTFIAAEQLSEEQIDHLRAVIAERAARSAERGHARSHADFGERLAPTPLTKT